MTEAGKDLEERACAECFLLWYNQTQKASYTLRRAQELYPCPKGKNEKIWDFVAIPSDNTKKQFAIEVKKLIRPYGRIQRRQWEGLLVDVNRSLPSTFCGKYLIMPMVALNPPTKVKYHVLRLTHKSRTRFASVLASIIMSAAPNMRTGAEINLGPAILAQFPPWPSRLKDACQLWLWKASDRGHCIKLGAPGTSPETDCFWHEEALRIAVDQAKITQAAKQLRFARKKGIEQTVLLLDLRGAFDWEPDTVKRILIDKQASSPDIDSIYLVKIATRCAKVWASAKTV